MKLASLVSKLDEWFPRNLAEDWDNTGLLVGNPQATVKRIMTCLTITPQTAAEALKNDTDLVISHHPIFFRGAKRLTTTGPDAHVYSLIRGGVAVYSPHTSFDGAEQGINRQLADFLDLSNARPLRPAEGMKQFKLVVFVTPEDLPKVQQAMFDAGAGVIGEYSECSFRLAGSGTFRGSDASNPTIGQKGRREEVEELRLETVVPARRLDKVVSAMRQAHSYEEPAFDIYPLHAADSNLGAGRIGTLPNPATLEEVAQKVGSLTGAGQIDVVGELSKRVGSVAVACGAGADFLSDAVKARCDVLVTGEARFHEALAAEQAGVGLILLGHYHSERFALETLAHRLTGEYPELSFWASESERDPLRRLAITTK